MVDISKFTANVQSMIIYQRTNFEGEACVFFLGLLPIEHATAVGQEQVLITYCNNIGLTDDIMQKQ